MSDKKTKKEIKEVLKKYSTWQGKTFAERAAKAGIASTSAAGFGYLVDLAMFGGLPVISLLAGSASLSIYANQELNGADFMKNPNAPNTAGQVIKAQPIVLSALNEMEFRLKAAFDKASAPAAQPMDKVTFMNLSVEIENDLKKLSSAFRIVSGGANGFGTGTYEFIVAERLHAPGRKDLITLTEGIQKLTQAPTLLQIQEQEIQDLKKRLDALENPKPVALEKPRFPRD